MAFQIASGPMNVVSWYPINNSETLYRGQIVESEGDGISPIGTPSGAFDSSNKTVILGIITGDNNATPVYDSTYKVNKIVGVVSQANQLARSWRGVEGRIYPKGDPQALVEVTLLTPWTVICGPVKNNDLDVAPTLLTVTTASSDGASSMVTNACEHTPVSDYSTIYCRTGANKGLYRITQDTVTTAPTNTLAFPKAVAVDDTLIRVPFRHGLSRITIDSLGMYVDNSATPTSSYYGVNVVDMDLSTAGEEKVWFTFAPTHFGQG